MATESNHLPMQAYDGELTRLLSRTNDPMQKLKRYAQFLPTMVVACPWLVIDHADEAERIACRLYPRNEHVEASIKHWRGEAYLRMRKARAALNDIDSAYESYCGMLSDRKKPDLLEETVRLAILAGEACVELRRYEDALGWFNKALTPCRGNDSELEATVEHALGNAYITMAQLRYALTHLHNALKIRERLGGGHTIGQSLHSIGRAYMEAGMYTDAGRILEQSLDAFQGKKSKKKPYFEVQVVADLAYVQQKLNNLPGALELALKAYEAYQALGDLVNAAKVGATIGGIYEEMEETEMAFDMHLKAYRLLDNHADDSARLPILLNVGRMHKTRGDWGAARLVFKWALEIAEKLGDQRLMYQLHQALASVLKALGYHERALYHHEMFVKLWQNVISEEQQREIARRQIDEDLKRAERRADEARNHAEYLERRLFETAAWLEERNTMLRKLEDQVLKLDNPADDEHSAILRTILSNIEQNRSIHKEWKTFEHQFNERYPDFVDNLYRLSSEIAPAELEVCYLAALGYDTKQISAIRDVGLRGTETQIRHIRRKLGLRSKDNFWTLMASLLKQRDESSPKDEV